jgi:L-threonylcarbamoyladenylate synthase
VVYPTETAYAVGGNALDEDVIEQVYAAKQRPHGKHLTTIASSLEMAKQYCTLTDTEHALCNEFMPGPLTVIADKKSGVPDSLNTDFVFRIPASPLCRALSERSDTPTLINLVW